MRFRASGAQVRSTMATTKRDPTGSFGWEWKRNSGRRLCGSLGGYRGVRCFSSGVFQQGKYVAIRREHQGGIFVKDFVISLQSLEEGVELGGLGILRIGTGV